MSKRLTLTGHWCCTNMDPITVTFEGCYARAQNGQIHVWPNGGEQTRYFVARYTGSNREARANYKAFKRWRKA